MTFGRKDIRKLVRIYLSRVEVLIWIGKAGRKSAIVAGTSRDKAKWRSF